MVKLFPQQLNSLSVSLQNALMSSMTLKDD